MRAYRLKSESLAPPDNSLTYHAKVINNKVAEKKFDFEQKKNSLKKKFLPKQEGSAKAKPNPDMTEIFYILNVAIQHLNFSFTEKKTIRSRSSMLYSRILLSFVLKRRRFPDFDCTLSNSADIKEAFPKVRLQCFIKEEIIKL